MVTKLALMLAFASLAAFAMRILSGHDDEAVLEREVAGQMDALREHLFRR
jgi:hypothetical protein